MKEAVIFLLFFWACYVQAQSPKSREHYLGEVKYYTEKIQGEPTNIANYYARGTFYHVLTNFNLSTKDFKTVLELYFKNPQKKYAKVATDACYFLADDYFFRNSDRQSAQSYINWGLSITPDDDRFEVLQIGILGSYPDKAAEAEKKFEARLAKYPNDEKLLLYYAKFLERKDIDRAIKFYKRVVSVNMNNIDALFALGAYYTNEASKIYKSGGDPGKVLDYTETSVRYFEMAHKVNPDDKELIEILIQCYENLNRDDDAKKMEKLLSK